MRIGLHAAEATRRSRDYGGKGVHVAARIGACAEGDEIVISASSFDGAAFSYPLASQRTLTLKGVSEPVAVATIVWR